MQRSAFSAPPTRREEPSRLLPTAKGMKPLWFPTTWAEDIPVLTAVGLLPIAVSGADIDAMMKGRPTQERPFMNPDIESNDCYKYAALRNILLRKGKGIEMLTAYEPRMTMMAEWFKQLYGESEGKDNKGLFPRKRHFLHRPSFPRTVYSGRRPQHFRNRGLD